MNEIDPTSFQAPEGGLRAKIRGFDTTGEYQKYVEERLKGSNLGEAWTAVKIAYRSSKPCLQGELREKLRKAMEEDTIRIWNDINIEHVRTFEKRARATADALKNISGVKVIPTTILRWVAIYNMNVNSNETMHENSGLSSFSTSFGNPNPAYGSQGSLADYGFQSPNPIYGSQNSLADYGFQSPNPIYGSQNSLTDYGYQSPNPIYGSQNSLADYGFQNPNPAYVSRNSPAAYGLRNDSLGDPEAFGAESQFDDGTGNTFWDTQ